MNYFDINAQITINQKERNQLKKDFNLESEEQKQLNNHLNNLLNYINRENQKTKMQKNIATNIKTPILELLN